MGRRLSKLQPGNERTKMCLQWGSCRNQRGMRGSCDGGEEAVVMGVRLMIRRTEVEEELKFFVPRWS